MRYEDTSGSLNNSTQPEARDDADTLPNGSNGPASGNVITGAGTTTGKAGADTPHDAHVVAVRGANGSDASTEGKDLHVDGRYGTLVIDEHGNYKYVADGHAPQDFRDLFQYTLADAKGQSVADLVITRGGEFKVSDNAQQIVPGPDGVVTLPAGVDLSDVHVVGRNLVVNLPDGQQIVIVDGAVFVPQLVVGGVELPSTNLAALLIDTEPKPAAGNTPSSGGDFADPVPPLDPGHDLGDLIPPTELQFPQPEFIPIGQFIDRHPDAGAASGQLDDDAQPGGNPGGIGDDPGGSSFNGTLPGSGGDGALTWGLLASGTIPSGFSYVEQPNGDIWIMQGNTHVITVTVDPTDGDYSVTQLQAISHPAGGDENNLIFVVNYTVTDSDGDVAPGTLTINVDDDTPVVNVIAGSDAEVILTTHDALTVGAASDSDTTSANFSGVFSGSTISYGADGQGPGSSDTYALAVTGSNSGLTSHGAAINLYLINGVVVGSTAASAGAVDASNTIFSVSTTNTGVVTLTQFQQIDHPIAQDPSPTGTPFDDQIISMADSLVTLTRNVTAVDGDGDSVTGSATVNIGANLHFTDDGPTVSGTLGDVSAAISDESPPVDPNTIPLVGGYVAGDDPDLSGGLAIGKGSTSGAVVDANAAFGADGPASGGGLTYVLDVLNATSGLTTTDGTAINLVELSNGVVVGVVDGTQTVAFAIQINSSTGVVTVEQYLSLAHPDAPNNFNESVFLNEGSLGAHVVATDFDGDTAASSAVDISSLIDFRDDGPSVAPTLNANATVTVDESLPSDTATIATGAIVKGDDPDLAGGLAIGKSSSGGAIVDAHAVFGADGPAASNSISYALSITDATSGLTLTDGTTITLQLVNGVIVGVVDGNGPFGGEAAFAIAIDAQTGVVSVEQYLSLNHPDFPSNFNEGINLGDNTIAVTVTATDGDGDQITSDGVDISHQITFLDDGPSVAPTLNANATVTVDESLPSDTATINTGLIVKGDDPDLAGGLAIGKSNSGTAVVDPHAVFGADGPAASDSISYALSITNGADAGVTLTDGTTIHLENVNGVIVGVVDGNGTFGGEAAFALSIDSTTGVVSLEQYLSLNHPDALDPNDALHLGTGAVGVTVTATDGDGDQITSGAVDISGQITFLDDGPAANDDTDTTDPLTDQASGNVITGVGTNEGTSNHDVPGADGFGAITKLVGFNNSTDSNPSGGFDVQGQYGTLHMDASGNYTYTRTGGPGGAEDTFTYTYKDGDGDTVSATLTITISDNTPTLPDPDTVHLDDDVVPGFNGNPAGTGDDPPDTVGQNVANGQLNGSGGDGTLTYSFTGDDTLPSTGGFTTHVVDADTVQILQGATVVLTIDLNLATGAYTVTQNAPILHPSLDGLPGDNTENNLDFSIGVQVQDIDGDPATAHITINVDDDTPTINVTQGSDSGVNLTTHDALTIGAASDTASSTANFGGVFGLSYSAGADGTNTTPTLGFALGVQSQGVDSGLNQGGTDIHLYLIGGVVVGSTSATEGGVNAGNTVFNVTVSGTGVVTLTQFSQIDHPIADDPTPTGAPFNDQLISMVDGLVTLTASSSITDKDGDTATDQETVNIGANLHFADDGPTINVTKGDDSGVNLTTHDALTIASATDTATSSANFGGVFGLSSTPGADGAASPSLGFALGVSAPGVDSGLNAHGVDIHLYLIGGVVVGSTALSAGAVNAGNTVFDVSVSGTGVVTLNQYSQIDHPAVDDPTPTGTPFNDQLISMVDSLITLTASSTITDNDGDTATDSETVNIGANLHFADDGPSAALSGTAVGTVTLDETRAVGTDTAGGSLPNGLDTATIDFSLNFVKGASVNYGADGAGSVAYSLSLTGSNVNSGLYALDASDLTTGDSDGIGQGAQIVLNLSGNTITGSVGLTNYFTITIDPSTGIVTFTQLHNIWNPTAGSSAAALDDTATLNTLAANLIQVIQTVTDFDGDTSQAHIDIGQGVFKIQDDGPHFTAAIQNQQTDNNPATSPAVGTLHFAPGTDGAGGNMTITADNTGITSGGHNLVTNQVGNVLTAYQDINNNGTYDSGTDNVTVYTVTVNPSAGTSGQYVFDLVTALDPTVTEVAIGGSSSFGAGPTLGQTLTDGASPTPHPLSVVSGYHPTASFDVTAWMSGTPLNGTVDTSAGVNGSTAGWGVDNNNFETNSGGTLSAQEIMYFDFGAQALSDPDGGGAFTPPAVTLPNITFAKFDFINYKAGAGNAGDDIAYVVHYTDGSSTSGWVPDANINGATWQFNAAAGKFIADISFYSGIEPDGTTVQNLGPGKIDLVSVGTTTSSIDKTPSFSLTLSDVDGDTTAATAFTVHIAAGLVPFAPAAPVVLDLNGDGVHFLSAAAGVHYDYGNGSVATAWASPQDGILVHDANGNHTVDNASEFVFGSGSVSDLQALNAYDTNHDGQLSSADAAFSSFGVWQDANSNGKVDAGEYHSLMALGITSISLTSDGIHYETANGDVGVVGTGSYKTADGATHALADAIFATGARSADTQSTASTGIGSTGILAAALAAAGLAASEPLAASPVHIGSVGETSSSAIVGVHNEALAPIALNSFSEVHSSALLPQLTDLHGMVTSNASAPHASYDAPSHMLLDTNFGSHDMSTMTALLSGTAMHDAVLSQSMMTANSVIMPSAQQLTGMMNPDGISGQHNQVVGQVLADALHGGGAIPNGNLDMLINSLPNHSGDSGNAVLADVSSHLSQGVSYGDMGGFGSFAAAHAMLTMEHMVMNQDAAPAHA